MTTTIIAYIMKSCTRHYASIISLISSLFTRLLILAVECIEEEESSPETTDRRRIIPCLVEGHTSHQVNSKPAPDPIAKVSFSLSTFSLLYVGSFKVLKQVAAEGSFSLSLMMPTL